MSTGPQMGSSFSPSPPFSFLFFPQVASGVLSDLPRRFIHSVGICRVEIREAPGRVRDSGVDSHRDPVSRNSPVLLGLLRSLVRDSLHSLHT